MSGLGRTHRMTNREAAGLGVLIVVGAIVAAPILFANWIYDQFGIPQSATYAILGFLIVACVCLSFIQRSRRRREQLRRLRAIEIADIDAMTGFEFECYLEELLISRGFSGVTMTPRTGDKGVDLVASCGADRFAIQAKRSNSKIDRRAVSDVVCGMAMPEYCCNRVMVITNSYFSPDAKTVAKVHKCSLSPTKTARTPATPPGLSK